MNGASVFQNMAPNAKRSFLISLCFASVAIIIYLFAVKPSEESLLKQRSALSDLESQRQRMLTDLKRADLVKKDLADLEEGLDVYRAAMLVPLLESYSMRARQQLDPLALGAGLKDINYADATFRALPLPKPMPRQLHTRAAVKLTARGSYQQAVSFLLRLEKEFPLISLRSLDIAVQPNNPDTQTIAMTLEWPAKGGLTRK